MRFLALFRADVRQVMRGAWFPATLALFFLLVLALEEITLFGFGRETVAQLELAAATMMLAWFILSLFGAEALLGPAAGSDDFVLTRPGGALASMAAAFCAVAFVSMAGACFLSHAVLAILLLKAGEAAAAAAVLVFCSLWLAARIAPWRRRPGGGVTLLLLLLPAPLWLLAEAPGNLPSSLVSGLIFGIEEGILISILCTGSQAMLPGTGGHLMASVAFLAGNMKGFLLARHLPALAKTVLAIALSPVPNLQALHPADRLSSVPTAQELAATAPYVFLFAIGILIFSTVRRMRPAAS